MEAHVIDVRDDRSIRALVITGAGRAFCSGGDINTFTGAGPPLEMRDRLRQRHRVTLSLYSLEKPVIAAVNGIAYRCWLQYCLAGRCHSGSRHGQVLPELQQGGHDSRAAEALSSLPTGRSAARQEMVLMSDVIDATQAQQRDRTGSSPCRSAHAKGAVTCGTVGCRPDTRLRHGQGAAEPLNVTESR